MFVLNYLHFLSVKRQANPGHDYAEVESRSIGIDNEYVSCISQYTGRRQLIVLGIHRVSPPDNATLWTVN